MISITPVVLAHQRRRDGTYLVKLRVTYRRASRYLPTAISVVPSQLTRSLQIKDPTVKTLAAALVRDLYDAAADLSPFALEAMDVDAVVGYIRAKLSAESWRLDFFRYAEDYIAAIPNRGTADAYRTAVNSFRRFRDGQPTDINAITAAMLTDYAEWIVSQPIVRWSPKLGRYVTCAVRRRGNGARSYFSLLAAIFRSARDRYNDEDAGQVRIPRQPFARVRPKVGPKEGQRAQSVELIQRLIDTPEDDRDRFAIDAFLISLFTMGANLADLYTMAPPRDGRIVYRRQKTRDRAGDRAEMRVDLLPELAPIIGRLRDGTGRRWLRLHLRWSSTREASTFINAGLRRWAERQGVEPFTFYAARHSFATLARKAGVDKGTVDECLTHVGDRTLADVYIERDYAILNDANRKVADLFRWG